MGRPVTNFQILSPEPERIADFCSNLFGWDIDQNNALGYRTIDTGSERGITGGIWPAPKGAPSFVQLFVEVEDVHAFAKKAESLGSKVLVPPQKLPDGEEMAVILSPVGLSFALVKPA